jgi:hypothetical protein
LVAHHAGRVMAAGGRTRASDRERGYVGGTLPLGERVWMMVFMKGGACPSLHWFSKEVIA